MGYEYFRHAQVQVNRKSTRIAQQASVCNKRYGLSEPHL